ncbi:unnamed protein product [Orchesella dallaii]|uniref:Gustatory receptor n=1 Tax=Orchesella dallaii TaxID=48710 RepID=A0ABP1Q9C3_9HEXA
MWPEYLRIYVVLQKIIPQRVIYNVETARFEVNPKNCRLYWWVNSQVVQANFVTLFRLLYYLAYDEEATGLSFVEFIVDLLIWAVTFIHMISTWTYWKKKDEIVFFLNQLYAHRKPTEYMMKPTFAGNGNPLTIAKSVVSSAAPSFSKAIVNYRVSLLIWEAVQRYGSILFPSLILAGYLVNVVTTFSCIKLFDQLPLMILVMLVVLDVSVFANTYTIHIFGLVMVFDFETFIQGWKRELKSKQCRRILRACFPIRLRMGQFFALNRESILITAEQIVDMTVTLLLV